VKSQPLSPRGHRRTDRGRIWGKRERKSTGASQFIGSKNSVEKIRPPGMTLNALMPHRIPSGMRLGDHPGPFATHSKKRAAVPTLRGGKLKTYGVTTTQGHAGAARYLSQQEGLDITRGLRREGDQLRRMPQLTTKAEGKKEAPRKREGGPVDLAERDDGLLRNGPKRGPIYSFQSCRHLRVQKASLQAPRIQMGAERRKEPSQATVGPRGREGDWGGLESRISTAYKAQTCGRPKKA